MAVSRFLGRAVDYLPNLKILPLFLVSQKDGG